MPQILFLGKKNNAHCEKALKFLQTGECELNVHLSERGTPFPDAIRKWEGQYIISFLSQWIVPSDVLNRAEKAAINFHPAPPAYPGTGCINFALYDEVQQYGATCHHMEAKVDTGGIIEVAQFRVLKNDTVESLLDRTYDFMLVLFYEIADHILKGMEFPVWKGEDWERTAYTRKELEELYTITSDMDLNEIEKRIRATSFGIFQPRIRLGNYHFELKGQ